MANKIMGITIDIEGKTSGLTKSLQEANSAISKTSSALKDVDRALQLDPSNIDLINQKEALLTKQIEQTNDKLEIMQQVANDANEALARGDISQEQYASLTAELVKTDQALADLENEANGSGDAMDEVGEGAETAANGLVDVQEESENTNSAFDTLGKGAAAVGAAMVAATTAMVAALKEVGGALVDCTVSAGDYVDEINTLSQKTGVSAESLQEFSYVSGLIDVDLNTFTGSLTKLEKTMNSAAESNEKYWAAIDDLDEKLKEGKITQEEYGIASEEAYNKFANGYDKLDISVKNADGTFRDSEEVFWDVIDALGEIEDPVERDLVAMDLLGKSAKELNPLINAGSDAYKQLAEEAHEVGYVMDGETMSAFQSFDDQMERFSKSGTAAKNALGTILLPMLSDLGGTATESLNEFTLAVQNSNGDIDAIGDAVSDMLPKIFESINKMAPKIFKLIGKIVDSLLQIFIDNLPEFVDTAMSIITALTDTLLKPENITKIISAAVTIVMTLAQYLIQNLPTIINAAMQVIVAVINGITQALPQLIPTIIEVVVTVVHTLIDNLPMLLQAIMELVIAVAMAIIDNLPEIIDALVEVISAVIEFLLSPEGIGLIAATGYKVFVALVEKLPEIIGDILGGVGEIVDGILKAFGFDEGLGKALSEVWNDIWEMIKGVINLIIGGLNGFTNAIEEAVNFFVDGINILIDGVNGLVGWIPGVSSHVIPPLGKLSIPDIPELATGAVIPANNPFLAVLGDQTHGTNIEAPLDTIKQAVAETVGLGIDQPIIIPVYIGQEKLDTLVATANRNNAFISGGR